MTFSHLSWSRSEFIPEILAQGGRAAGADHAVLFRGYDLGPGMRD
ncbi:hypothetical protein [Nostocoides veronense]